MRTWKLPALIATAMMALPALEASAQWGGPSHDPPRTNWRNPTPQPTPSARVPRHVNPFSDVREDSRARSAMEEAIVHEMNALRRDPAAYAEHLMRMRPYYDGRMLRLPRQTPIMTEEGVAALDEAVAALRRARAAPELRRADVLDRAARDHASDLGRKGHLGHSGSDGSSPGDRVSRHGQWRGAVAENITFGSMSAREVVVDLLIDDGVRDRGHRRVLLDQGLRLTGVACGPHPTFRLTCVITYANALADEGGSPVARVPERPPGGVVPAGPPAPAPWGPPGPHAQPQAPRASPADPWAGPSGPPAPRAPAPRGPDSVDPWGSPGPHAQPQAPRSGPSAPRAPAPRGPDSVDPWGSPPTHGPPPPAPRTDTPRPRTHPAPPASRPIHRAPMDEEPIIEV